MVVAHRCLFVSFAEVSSYAAAQKEEEEEEGNGLDKVVKHPSVCGGVYPAFGSACAWQGALPAPAAISIHAA
jgi:hypothetical protein